MPLVSRELQGAGAGGAGGAAAVRLFVCAGRAGFLYMPWLVGDAVAV